MKKMNKVLSVLSLLFVLIFASCSLFPAKTTKKAKVSFQLAGAIDLLDSNPKLEALNSGARNAGSYTVDSISNENLYYKLYYIHKVDGEDIIALKDYDCLTDLLGDTLEIEYDTWKFILEVYESRTEDERIYEGNIENFVINAETVTVTIDLEFSIGQGGIKYTINYPDSDENIELEAFLRKKEDDGYITLSETVKNTYTEDEDNKLEKVTEDGVSSVVYEIEALDPGYYAVVFKLIYTVGEETDETIGMQLAVPVIPTITTTGSYDFTEINKAIAINYDETSLDGASIVEGYEIQEYPAACKRYRTKKLPELSKENNTFLGWYYYDNNSTKISISKNDSGYYVLNESYNIDSDVTLYAEWEPWVETTVVIGTLIPDFTVKIDNDVVSLYETSVAAVIPEYQTFKEGTTAKWYINNKLVEGVTGFEVELPVGQLDSIKDGSNRVTALVECNGEYKSQTSWFYTYDVEIVANDSDLYFTTNYKFEDESKLQATDSEVLTACCFDSKRNLYASLGNTSALKFVKFEYNKQTKKYSESTDLYTFEDYDYDDSHDVPAKLVTDDDYLYFIQKTVPESYVSIGLDFSNNTNKLYYLAKNSDVIKSVAIDDFDYVTSLAYNDNVLYVAGEKLAAREDASGYVWDYRNSEKIAADYFDAIYSIYAYNISKDDSGIVSLTKKSSSPLVTYKDSDFVTENSIFDTYPTSYMPDSNTARKCYKVEVNNIITDMAIVQGNLYVIQNMFVKTIIQNIIEDIYGSEELIELMKFGYANLLNINLDEESYNVIELPKEISAGKSFVPTKFIAVKPEELVLADGSSSEGVCSIYLSGLKTKFGTYGEFKFDQILAGSGISYANPMEYHLYNSIFKEIDY